MIVPYDDIRDTVKTVKTRNTVKVSITAQMVKARVELFNIPYLLISIYAKLIYDVCFLFGCVFVYM